MHKFSFYNKFIILVYMFRALLCSSSGGQIVLYSIWYLHTETSEWSKITKIQFYKYEHIVVKVIYEFFGCNCRIFLHYEHVITCRGYVYPVVKLIKNVLCLFLFLWRCGRTRAMASSFLRFLDHTQRRITVGRTPLDLWSVRHSDLYLTTHNTHNGQTSMLPLGFEPTISAGERP